jgi:hypothetical protein
LSLVQRSVAGQRHSGAGAPAPQRPDEARYTVVWRRVTGSSRVQTSPSGQILR